MKFKESDIQVSNNKVLVKQYDKSGNFNWVCVATFHFNKGISSGLDEAKAFAQSITA